VLLEGEVGSHVDGDVEPVDQVELAQRPGRAGARDALAVDAEP
jgi:hypothetical protein